MLDAQAWENNRFLLYIYFNQVSMWFVKYLPSMSSKSSKKTLLLDKEDLDKAILTPST